MRVGRGLIAGSLVVAGAVGVAWSQTAKQVDPGQVTTVAPPAPAAISDLRIKPTGDGRLSTPVTTVKELNAAECEILGGTVMEDIYRVCASGKFCHRVDNYGKKYNVCLSPKE